jgi:DNA-binding NarL/FixJ family response regulator
MDHPKLIKVVAVIDHLFLHGAIQEVLKREDRISLAGTETTGACGLRLISKAQPDVAVIDFELGDINGLVLAEEIIKKHPNIGLVILTGNEDRVYVQRALQIGVKAYISKRSHVDHLLRAIAVTAEGAVYIDPVFTPKLVECPYAKVSSADVLKGQAGSVRLTEREEAVVRLVALGHSIKEIAGLVGVSAKSAQTYKAHASDKLGLRSRTQLVRYAASRGWTSNQ